MKVILSKVIDTITTNAVDDTPEWVSGTETYVAQDRIKRSTTKKIYEARQDMDPAHASALPEDTNDYWAEVKSVNDWAMFDMYTSTQTKRDTSLTVTVPVNKCDHFALFNLDGVHTVDWSITQTGMSEPSSSGSISLFRRNISDWYDFFFSEFEFRADVVQDIPITFGADLTVTFTGSTVAVGHMAVGRAMVLGAAKYQARGGFIDYSKDTTNDYGIATLQQGRVAKRMELTLYVEPYDMDRTMRIITATRGKGSVWVGDNTDQMTEASETLLVYGRPKEVKPCFEEYGMYTNSLTIEGLA